MRAFWAWNSASVRTPAALSSPSFCSASSMSPWLAAAGWAGGGGGGGGGAAYSCCGSSWAAQRFACRRDTRFDTAVAVPATTAVRAIPRIKPMSSAFLFALLDLSTDVGGFNRIQRGQHVVGRDASAGDHLGAGAPHGRDKRARPCVLVQDQPNGTAWLDELDGLAQIVVIEEAGFSTFEDGKVEQPVTVEIRDIGCREAPILLTLDASQVEYSDDPPIDQVDQNAETLASKFRLGKFDGQVIDWPYILLSHCSNLPCHSHLPWRPMLPRPTTMLSLAGSRRLHP